MNILKNSQIEQEHKCWQRSIEFFRQENALLKYRLSELVDHNEEHNFLQTAEYFQNQLLLKDEMLKKLIDDLGKYDLLIKNKSVTEERIMKTHLALRKNLLLFQKQYLDLSKKFNEQMLLNIEN